MSSAASKRKGSIFFSNQRLYLHWFILFNITHFLKDHKYNFISLEYINIVLTLNSITF